MLNEIEEFDSIDDDLTLQSTLKVREIILTLVVMKNCSCNSNTF